MSDTKERANVRRTQHSKREVLQKSFVLLFFVDGAKKRIAFDVIPELAMESELCVIQN